MHESITFLLYCGLPPASRPAAKARQDHTRRGWAGWATDDHIHRLCIYIAAINCFRVDLMAAASGPGAPPEAGRRDPP